MTTQTKKAAVKSKTREKSKATVVLYSVLSDKDNSVKGSPDASSLYPAKYTLSAFTAIAFPT